MISRSITLIALLTAWMAAGSSASAQFDQTRIQYPFGQPAVSPYLNLVGNNNAGINYFGIVRPQQQFYQQSEDLRRGVYTAAPYQRQLPTRRNGLTSGYRLGVTGHTASFRSLGTQLPVSKNANRPTSLSARSRYSSAPAGSTGMTSPDASAPPAYSGHSSGFGFGPVNTSGREF